MPPAAEDARFRPRAASDLHLLGYLQSVVHLDTEVPDRALKPSMTKKKLDRPDVLRPAIDKGGFGPTERMRSVASRIQPDASYPGFDDPGVLSAR